jgi:hypothetical protein
MEADSMQTGHYSSQKDKLLYDFDRTAQLVVSFVAKRNNEEYAAGLYRDARQEYEAIIPQVPYIDGARARPLNAFLRITAQEVAVYKAMKKHGKTPGEAWEICHEAIRMRMEEFPKWKAWLFRRLMYSPLVKRRIRRRAEKNEQLRFGDFEVRYVIGDGKGFDWGVDYVRCGNLELVTVCRTSRWAVVLAGTSFAPRHWRTVATTATSASRREQEPRSRRKHPKFSRQLIGYTESLEFDERSYRFFIPASAHHDRRIFL